MLTALSVQFHTLISVTHSAHTHRHTQTEKRPVASSLTCVDGLRGRSGGVTHTCTPFCALIPARGKALCA